MLVYKSGDYIDPLQPFGIVRNTEPDGADFPLHRHEFMELVYVTSGKSTHCVDGVTYPVNGGEILFIGYRQSHSFHVEKEMRYFNFLVKPEYISRSLADAQTIYDVFSFLVLDTYFDDESRRVPVIRLAKPQKLELDALAEKMYEESVGRESGYELALDGYMRLILSRIFRCLRQTGSQGFLHSIMPGLLAYIDSNYTRKLTLSELANKCFYNPAYLGRLFRNTFHLSLREYICEKRMLYAKELLDSTGETVEQIAAQVGYEEKGQFYRAFKEKFGCTPTQYRRSAGGPHGGESSAAKAEPVAAAPSPGDGAILHN